MHTQKKHPYHKSQVCQQEMQLAAGAKLTQDLKAALLLVCGVLKQTSFVEADVSAPPLHWRRGWAAPWGLIAGGGCGGQRSHLPTACVL
jgi:hypothetical protein